MLPEPAKYLPLAWIIASEQNGQLPDIQHLAFRLRLPPETIKVFLKAGNLISEMDTLATC